MLIDDFYAGITFALPVPEPKPGNRVLFTPPLSLLFPPPPPAAVAHRDISRGLELVYWFSDGQRCVHCLANLPRVHAAISRDSCCRSVRKPCDKTVGISVPIYHSCTVKFQFVCPGWLSSATGSCVLTGADVLLILPACCGLRVDVTSLVSLQPFHRLM